MSLCGNEGRESEIEEPQRGMKGEFSGGDEEIPESRPRQR